jgi:hypothetical protein
MRPNPNYGLLKMKLKIFFAGYGKAEIYIWSRKIKYHGLRSSNNGFRFSKPRGFQHPPFVGDHALAARKPAGMSLSWTLGRRSATRCGSAMRREKSSW